MKEILNALKPVILGGISEIKEVHILDDPNILTETARFPCAGLKDEGQSFSEGMAETESEKGSIMIYIYVQILKEEASIMGDGTSKGLLDLAKEMRALLNWNTLGGIIQHAYCPDSPGSEIMMKEENVFVQRKGVKFNYEE